MLLDHDRYVALAQKQHVIQTTLSAQRGEIYTSDGYPLVINTDAYLMFVVPKEIDDKAQFNKTLIPRIVELVEQLDFNLQKDSQKTNRADLEEEPALSLPQTLHALRLQYDSNENQWQEKLEDDLKSSLEDLLRQKENLYVPILSKLDPQEKEVISQMDLAGVHFQDEAKRFYPEKEMAAHVLGFVGKDEEGENRGYFGLEGFYDGHLSGRSGYEIWERDVGGRRIPFGLSKLRKPSHGRDLILTIRRELQYLLEKKIKQGVEKYQATNGTAILLDPNSGAVWGMTNYPTFLPEYWFEQIGDESDVSKIEIFKNTAISANYEPGSVLKSVNMSIAINEEVVTAESTYQDDGPVTYSGYVVRTWDNKYHGEITMTQILQLSNNTGAAWVGHQIGFDRYAGNIAIFNLGNSLGIDLEGEESGIVRDRQEWRDIDLANMAFGQGISLTPIQLTTAFSSVINGGKLYEPFVVEKIVDHRGSEPLVIERSSKLITQTISAETSEKLRLMLRKVVTDGEFKWFVKQAGMDKFEVAGKTGTAQIPVEGRYDPNKTNVTFIGFAPMDEPKFVLLVRLNQPTTSSYSADTAVPLWLDIAKELMIYFEIPPIR